MGYGSLCVLSSLGRRGAQACPFRRTSQQPHLSSITCTGFDCPMRAVPLFMTQSATDGGAENRQGYIPDGARQGGKRLVSEFAGAGAQTSRGDWATRLSFPLCLEPEIIRSVCNHVHGEKPRWSENATKGSARRQLGSAFIASPLHWAGCARVRRSMGASWELFGCKDRR